MPLAAKNGTPVMVRDLATVAFGPDIRQGAADWQGEGETVGGIIVMRDGMNALNVIDGVKSKLAEIKPSLPPGVEIVAGYDRSGLIHASIDTLQRDLLEEAVIVSLVIIVFLFHFRSALIPILTLPIAVLAAFIPMYYLHVSSNIMSLGGLALAIGVLVDAAIVMVENGYRHLAGGSGRGRSRFRNLSAAASCSTPPSRSVPRSSFHWSSSWFHFFRSFCSKRRKAACSGRWPGPRPWPSAFSSLLAITLVPVLMVVFIRGKLRPESRNPLSRITQAIYLPILRLACGSGRPLAAEPDFSGSHASPCAQDRQPVHAAAV